MGSTDSEKQVCQRICDFPDDLILRILHLLPTKDAVATSILSKRWRYIWTMLSALAFKDEGSTKKSIGWVIDKTLQLHKAPKLLNLVIKLGPTCPVDVDVRKWIEKAVHRGVTCLDFNLLWKAEPTSFPMSLYTCDTLVSLTLSNKILVDVSSSASLPSLLSLELYYVVYKDQDSLARLLSSAPLLKRMDVKRHEGDNLINFTVKVSSLKLLYYEEEEEEEEEGEGVGDDTGSLVIDCPALTDLYLDVRRDYCLIENMPCLDKAHIHISSNTDENFMRSLSSTTRLYLGLTESVIAYSNAIKFSRLTEFYFFSYIQDWLEPLICLLQNSPNLKILTIDTAECLSSSWNPSTVPECLSSHLEILRWIKYEGKEHEKQLMSYILANSKCLKKVVISFLETCNGKECQKEIESMPRISTLLLLASRV